VLTWSFTENSPVVSPVPSRNWFTGIYLFLGASVFGGASDQPGGNHLGQPYARPRLRDIRSSGLLPFPGLRKTESVKGTISGNQIRRRRVNHEVA
jgi:hypothetical protein